MFLEIISKLAGSLGLVLGVLYLIGGAIVNIYLGKYRLTEYQIVSVQFLVVGIVFLARLLEVLATPFFGALAVIILVKYLPQWIMYIVLALSLLGAFLLLLSLRDKPTKIPKNPENQARRQMNWLGGLTLWFPVSVFLLSQMPEFRGNVTQIEQMVGLTFTALMLGMAAIATFYARKMYGEPTDDVTDWLGLSIGKGVPRLVQLVGASEDMGLLAHLEIPLVKPELSREVFLIGETSDHYIVTMNPDDFGQAIKIQKTLVKAMRYRGTMRAKKVKKK